jgi:hypothetical protein
MRRPEVRYYSTRKYSSEYEFGRHPSPSKTKCWLCGSVDIYWREPRKSGPKMSVEVWLWCEKCLKEKQEFDVYLASREIIHAPKYVYPDTVEFEQGIPGSISTQQRMGKERAA